jgi:hypothetical protein
MELLFENNDIRVVREDGTPEIAIISFAGISFGVLDRGEFRGSLSAANADIYYVFDKERRWYNGQHAEVALELLNEQIDLRNSGSVFALGNSMGATGAISLARDIHRCQRSIAFCPQSSVHPEIAPFEVRWRDLRRSINEWTAPDAVDRIVPDQTYFIFFGTDDELDLRHASRFGHSGTDSVNLFLVPGCGHDVAAHLKQRGVLADIIEVLTQPADVPAGKVFELIPDAIQIEAHDA